MRLQHPGVIVALMFASLTASAGLEASTYAYRQGNAIADSLLNTTARQRSAIEHWQTVAAGYAAQLDTVHGEAEVLRARLAAAEARTPFDVGFLKWADSGVTQCESSDNPRATNGNQVGLLQIDVPSHRARIARHSYTPADLLRPIPSLIVAESIWREQGSAPWPNCGRAR